MSLHDDDENPNYKFHQPDDDAPDIRDTAGDEQEFIRCPHCRKYIFEQAEQCPYCRQYVEEEKTSHKPLWFIITAVFCLLIALAWALWG